MSPSADVVQAALVSPPLILGIAGGTGSGKTTVATKIVEALGPHATRIDHDSYYQDASHLSFEERQAINYDHPESLDNELLRAHILALKAGSAVDKPIYDYVTHTRRPDTTRIDPAPVVLVEGILTLAILPIRELFDVKIFVDTADDIRLMRRIRRDIEQRGRSFGEVRKQYYDTVRPMHLAFVEPSKRFADLIIPEGGENHIAIDIVVGRIRHFLWEREEGRQG